MLQLEKIVPEKTSTHGLVLVVQTLTSLFIRTCSAVSVAACVAHEDTMLHILTSVAACVAHEDAVLYSLTSAAACAAHVDAVVFDLTFACKL